MKKTLFAALLTVGLAAGIAHAYNGTGQHMMNGPQMMNGPMMMNGTQMMGAAMTGGSAACPMAAWGTQSGAQYNKFLDDTVDLRKQLADVEFAYAEARRNTETSPEQLRAMEQQMAELQGTLQQKAQTYR